MPLYNSPQAYVFNLQTTSSAEAKRLSRSKIKEEWGYCGSQDNLTIDHIVPTKQDIRNLNN
jgi:5-methylcytosine-specific restriction endonuclease McrA